MIPMDSNASSRYQDIIQNIQIMEEQMKIYLLGHETNMTINQIYNLDPVIKEQQIKELKLPFHFSKFMLNLQVLHACMYYLIAIQKNVYSSSAIDFRERCLLAIESYYIKLNMSFQLYQYGYLCSRILSYPLEKSLHIIYFLIYARLASKPYIMNLIGQVDKKRKMFKKQTCKSQKDESVLSNSVDSRHMTIFMESSQMEVENFRRDLKKILNSQSELKKTSKKNDNKRYFNLKKIYPDEQMDYKFQEETTEPLRKNASTSRVLTIPLKAGPNDHSSVINRLKFHSGKSLVSDNFHLSKLMMRRQKFDNQFSGGQKYESLRKEEEKSIKQWVTQKVIAEEKIKGAANVYRIQKHPYEYFREMTHSIKSKNKQLDVIRSQCLSSSLLRTIMANKELQYRDQNQSVSAFHTTQFSSKLDATGPTGLQRMEGKQNVEGLSSNRQSVSKTESQGRDYDKSVSEAASHGSELMGGLITRKNDQINQEQERLMLFGKKMKSKFKLQKYKEEYRHFLKTQMFQKVRNIT